MEGYDAKFDPPLDKRLECPICLLAQREPMQTPCGHRFCSACILRALSETGTRCPVDNTRVAVHQLFKDNYAKREVLSLHVHCHAEEHGCIWEGELRSLECHERICELVTITCPNDCGHVCQRKGIHSHLPLCSNHICPCSNCSISCPRNKLSDHGQFCSKIKLPSSITDNISSLNEVLKWCGHLKMKVHGQNYSAVGYLSAKTDSEEQFIYSGCWSSNINLIPLMGAASKLFWKTLKGPEVKPVELYFGILNVDSKSSNFQKMLKKKVNAAIGLRLKPSSRRELMIMYIHWSESQKRLVAYVAELRNYLVREMQRKLQPLRRQSQYAEFSRQLSENILARSRNERTSSSRRGYSAPVRVINVPPTVPAASIENSTPVVPSILSWQLSPSFPAYSWRVQAGGPSVPFFTIPSTPPQFLPAHSYPYTFAPMPAIAAPPFSINPIQPVPAPLTIPSYAGVSVPQVSGLHAELVASSANNSTIQGPGRFIDSTPMTHLSAGTVIHPYAHTTQDPTLSMPPGPAHPVSVVVDARLNPQNVVHSSESRRESRQRQSDHAHWVQQQQRQQQQQQQQQHRSVNNNRMTDARSSSINRLQSSSNVGSERVTNPESLYHVDARYTTQRRSDMPMATYSNIPGPSGLQQVDNHSTTQSPSNMFLSNSGINLESSDDDYDADSESPFQWSINNPNLFNSPVHAPFIDGTNDFMSSASSSPSIGGSADERSPTSQQRAMGSALQTLADAAALLSSSPQSISNSSDDTEQTNSSTMSPLEDRRTLPNSSSSSLPMTTTSSQRADLHRQQQNQPVTYSSLPPATSVRHSYQQNHNRVLTITQQPQPNVYNNIHPSQLAPAGYHTTAHFEELPLFVPVIHPSVDSLEAETVNPIAGAEGTAVIYTPHENGGVVVTSPPIQMAEVPPLIRIATAPNQRNIIPEQWPIVEQRTAQQIPPPPAGFIRPQPVVTTAPPGGGFWEEVMPSLDMRLHEAQF